jgi:hypothetical protein
MVRNELRLGFWFMEQTAASCCRLGARSLGASRAWLGLGSRSLALTTVREIDLHRVALKIFLRRDA